MFLLAHLQNQDNSQKLQLELNASHKAEADNSLECRSLEKQLAQAQQVAAMEACVLKLQLADAQQAGAARAPEVIILQVCPLSSSSASCVDTPRNLFSTPCCA